MSTILPVLLLLAVCTAVCYSCSSQSYALQELQQKLESAEADDRNAICYELAKLGEVSVPTIIRVLEKDSSWSIRKTAAEVLGQFSSQEVITALVGAFHDKKYHEVGSAAAHSLVRIGEPAWKQVMEAALDPDMPSSVRIRATYTLVSFVRKELAPVFQKLADDPYHLIAEAALTGLQRLFKSYLGYLSEPGSNPEMLTNWEDWWPQNKDYLYHPGIVESYVVDLVAKQNHTPIHPDTRKPLNSKGLTALREREALVERILRKFLR